MQQNSPQLENGYTAIANELYEVIAKWRFSSYEYRILTFIIRKTYGWNKKSDWISLSQFVEGTGIRDVHVCRTINLLIKQNVITKGGKKHQPEYSVQKHYSDWEKLPKGVRSHHAITKGGNDELPKGVIPKGVNDITKGGNPALPKGGDTKDNIVTKATVTKASVADAPPELPNPKETAVLFFQGVKDLLNKKEVPWLQEMLKNISEKNNVPKARIWGEVCNFCSLWTERNGTGTRERWQLQKTFEVNLRLGTWLRRAGMREFSMAGYDKKKGKEIIT